ncbi:HNH endonuclease [Duganella sp. LX47W]|uniref:HNH endonuclease n=2 Tax=Rugamonas apoptosis TaxID=2758570 RepID=A0A7W2FCH0_9BURK|nr:HNH endonuclease [Rugamonas apoptosis]
MAFREPIPAIWDAARFLDAAVSAYQNGHRALAVELIEAAKIPEVGQWGYSIWGAKSPYFQLEKRPRNESGFDARVKQRMPTLEQKRLLHRRDGYQCRFCGIPVIRAEVRKKFCLAFPELQIWGATNETQHVAFQTMWAQYDHVIPHSAGGQNDLNNLVVACGPCNFGRMDYTLEEVSLVDPREREPVRSAWDGLERFLAIT